MPDRLWRRLAPGQPFTSSDTAVWNLERVYQRAGAGWDGVQISYRHGEVYYLIFEHVRHPERIFVRSQHRRGEPVIYFDVHERPSLP